MKYLKWLFNILSWLVYLCIAVYLLIAAPLFAGFRPVVVLSGSMEPTYHVGSIIYYRAVSFDQIENGAVITFRAGEESSLVTHRVTEKRELSREFVTKGDANNTADPNPVSYEAVEGKAASVSIPYAGYLITCGKRPMVIAVMAAILMISMLLDNMRPGAKGRKSDASLLAGVQSTEQFGISVDWKIFGLAAAAAVGVTWAAWMQVLRTGNEYMIPRYKTSLEERFRQPDDWQPGITTQKQVWVSNSLKGEDGKNGSGVPAIAKAEIHQSWIRRENVYEKDRDGRETAVPPLEGESLPIVFQTEDGRSRYAAVVNFSQDNVVVLSSGMTKEEGLRLGLDYVDTPGEARGKWLLVDEKPAETGNYILYYMEILQPGEDSPVFLESVTMNPLLENTISTKDTYYEKAEDGYRQITVTNRNAKYGYDASRYTMDIKATTVQATKAAVEHTFSDGFFESVIYYLVNEIADPAIYDASDLEKKLTIVYNSGKRQMEYVPYRTEDGAEEGNWFMTFTDMVPGGIYRDRLLVENTTKFYPVRVYMRIAPRVQDEIKNELLEKITMRVTFQEQVLYEGKATGAQYDDGADLQNIIPLCYLKAGQREEIRVELQLDPDITCDSVTGARVYADQLTKIDWEFMIQEDHGGGGHDPGGNDPGGNTPGGNTSGGGDSEEPGTPTEHIGDGDVPLASVMIPEEGVPLIALARTGDDSNMALTAAMSVISLVLLAVTGMIYRKCRKELQK